ncbi:MFS transporter [bacterium]|nr:MFS transporter [Akkermansiaceae bacterium]MDB4526662.1 MFS transporter [bacterium]MDB4526677.1 MFS transporter [bacterium]MDB4792940.1 MFS transporter [bacterium]
MNNPSSKLLYWAITCALAGFIFGFDLIVISGAEQKIQTLWGLSGLQHGLAMSAALWGTVVGAIFGGRPTDKYGRKNVLLWIGILYFVSAIGSAFAPNVTLFAISRFIGGIGIGVSTVAAPLFISEISPADRRGRLTGMFQFNIVLGLLVATISNAAILWIMGSDSETAWRWMLGIEAIPALIYSFMCFGLPESPRWLIDNGQRDEGKKILGQINPTFSEAEIEAAVTEIEQAADLESGSPRVFWKPLKLALVLAFLIAFFNQLSGINAILGYAPRILGMTGFAPGESLFNATLITLVNLIFTLVGLRLIDKLGRRSLLYIGSIGYIASLSICAWAFHNYNAPFADAADALALKADAPAIAADISKLPEKFTPQITVENLSEEKVEEVAEDSLTSAKEESGAGSTLVLICILGFIAAHAIGQGAVIWVFISEIFPAVARGFGQSLGSATHWVFAAILTFAFPLAMEAFTATKIFGFFAFMMILQLIWVKLMVPETKGVSLEDMQNNLTKQ